MNSIPEVVILVLIQLSHKALGKASLTNSSAKAINNFISDDLNWKIVGGYTAADGQFPYMVSLRDASGFHFCGGSIINNNWVVTAAHCMAQAYPENLFVVAGTNTLRYGGISHPVSQIFVHPNYNAQFKNDIALIQLSVPITYTATIQPISLGNIDGGSTCVLSGWGSLYLGSVSPNNLQYLYLRTLGVQECQQYLPETGSSQICTLIGEGQGACHGDSGGPLAANGALVGIVSYGMPCAKGMPDVFTRVASFVSWINNFVN